MDHPPPSDSSGQPALTPADPPAGTGTPVEPKLTEVEVLYTDCEWHPATVLGWYRLNVAHEQLLTGLWVFWLIHLRLDKRTRPQPDLHGELPRTDANLARSSFNPGSDDPSSGVQQTSTATLRTASVSRRLPSGGDLLQRPRATSPPRVRIEGR